MKPPTNRELEAAFAPGRPADLSSDQLVRAREYSRAVFGNQDRLEVAVAITRFEEDVNATDLNREIDVAVNRIRAQLLALTDGGALVEIGRKDGKRLFKRASIEDPLWAFVVAKFEELVGEDGAAAPARSSAR